MICYVNLQKPLLCRHGSFGRRFPDRQSVQKELSFPSLLIPTMVHGKGVFHVQEASWTSPPVADALITDVRGVALGVTHADCQAALFFDEEHRAIGVAHAGWRGQAIDIYREVISSMEKAFGTRPSSLQVAISPSLGPESAQFIHYQQELPPSFHRFQTAPLYFDLWGVARKQLEEAGVLPSNISFSHIDTMQDPDWFSYRRDKGKGRNHTAIGLI